MSEIIIRNAKGVTILNGMCRYCREESATMTDYFCCEECRQKFLKEAKVICELPYNRASKDGEKMETSKIYSLFGDTYVIYNALLGSYNFVDMANTGIIGFLVDIKNTLEQVLKETGTEDYEKLIKNYNEVSKENERIKEVIKGMGVPPCHIDCEYEKCFESEDCPFMKKCEILGIDPREYSKEVKV